MNIRDAEAQNDCFAMTWEMRKLPEENQAKLTSFLICSKNKELISGVKFLIGVKNTYSA